MHVITSLGIPARVRRANEAGATPLAPEPRDSRPAPGASSDPRAPGPTTTVVSNNNPT